MNHSIDSGNVEAHRKRALWCGFLPLIAGGLTMLAWESSGSALAAGIGVMTLVLGCFLFVLGAISIWQYQAFARQQTKIPRGKIVKDTFLISSLLLLNFPAAGACIFWALNSASHYIVIIRNESAHTLSQIELVSGSETIRMDPIKPGGKDSYNFRDIGEWSLILNAQHNGRPVNQEVDGYTTQMGTTAHVNLLPDESFQIHLTSRFF